MKKISFFALLGIMAVALVGCKDKNAPQSDPQSDEPQQEQEVIPSAFPKKHLIEEFTGQDCGYCPAGMQSVHDFIENDSSFILVLHHAGYSPDHFTVDASQTISSELKVSGAPTITINRSKIKYSGNKSAITFHPGYLPDTKKSQLADSTYVSVRIANTYDPSSRQLKVKVSGAFCDENYPVLHLTVLVKESGMIDYQSDYYDTFEGWEEFRHTNAVRAILSEVKGDIIDVDTTRHYIAEYALTLDQDWKAENCMVVAFLSESFKPVVQVEQAPVVSGTKGGADIQHGGLVPVPVAEYYPEPNETDGPAAFSGNNAENVSATFAYYSQYPSYGITVWAIQGYNASSSINVGGTPCVPFINISLYTDYNASPDLPAGTYTIDATEQPGTIFAGYRNDNPPAVGGAAFYFTSLSYLQEGYLVPMAQWLIVDGQMTITKDGWILNGHARNGAEIRLVGTTPIQVRGAANAPVRRRARVPYLL